MKHLMWVLLVSMSIAQVSAQDVYTSSGKSVYHKNTKKKKKGYDPDKLVLGGGFGFDLGDGYFSAGISPIVGYRFTDRFSAGVGVGYEYFQVGIPDPYNSNNTLYQKDNLIYPNVWSRYFFWRNWYAVGQFEYDLIRDSYPLNNYGNVEATVTNVTNPCLLLGAGYRFPLGGRASFLVEGLYDILQGQYSPYPPGFPSTLRFSVVVGL